MAASHTLFLIHGMGKPNSKMFEIWKDSLARHHDTYAENGDEFAQQFECVPIDYDRFFEERRNDWLAQINGILEAGIDLPDKKLTREDLSSLTEDNIFTTHLMDVLLYRFDSLVADEIRNHVCERMLERINDRPAGGKVSVIAYSLGTAIAHDAINILYHRPEGHETQLTTGEFRFHAIIQLANVSRILETRWPAFKSYVQPGVGNAAEGQYATTRMLSASHKFDPLVSLRGFSPIANWPNAITVKEKRIVTVNPNIIQRLNVHDFLHYLDDPRVHIPMFRFLRTKGFVSKGKETEAYYQFDKSNPIAEFDDYRRELRALLSGEDNFSWKRLADVFKKFSALVREVIK